jgi:hypothetical protein
LVFEHLRCGPIVTYRHREVAHFNVLKAALRACDFASRHTLVNCCILDDDGQEYFEGQWMSSRHPNITAAYPPVKSLAAHAAIEVKE